MDEGLAEAAQGRARCRMTVRELRKIREALLPLSDEACRLIAARNFVGRRAYDYIPKKGERVSSVPF